MSRSSYTSSERRGMLAIAFIAFLLIASGVGLSFYNRSEAQTEEAPQVLEHPELIDSISVEGKKKSAVRKKSKTKKSSSNRSRQKKTYRKRSPLDEPV